MRKMKNSEIDWLNFIPENWKIKRVKQILAERNEKNNPIKSTNLLSLSIERGVFPYSEKTGGGNKAKEKFEDYKLTYENDIVLNSMNIVVGSVGLSKYYGCVSPVYYTLYSRNENYNINYYNNIFQSEAFQKSLWGLGNGIVVKESDNGKLNTIRMRIPMEKLNNVLMPVPPRDEQRKIAEFLDGKVKEINNIIEKTKETIEDYKKYKQSIITEIVTKGLEKNTKMKETGVDWIKTIPKNWKISPLKNIVEFGKGLPITKADLVSKGNAVISYGQIHSKKNKCICIDNDLIRYVSDRFLDDKYSIYKALKNDFIFADTSEDLEGTGNCVYIDREDVFAGYHTIKVHPISNKNYQYLAYLFMTDCWRSQLRARVSGIKLFSITQKILKETTVIIPTDIEMKDIVKKLNEKCANIENIIESKQKMIEELKKYKNSLIYEYVTGKKEVKENNLLKKNDAEEIKINCKDNIFAQAILLCRIIEKLNKHNLGRVKAEKALYLIERDIGFNFENNYVREKAGPLSEAIYKCESVISKKNRWVKINNKKNSIEYEILPNFSNYNKYYKKYYSVYDKKIERIIKIIKDYSMDKAEMVATLYASWNDFIIKKEEISDIKIVKDVRENWNDTKKRFKENEWLDVLKEMKQVGLIPKGKGNLTIIKEQ